MYPEISYDCELNLQSYCVHNLQSYSVLACLSVACPEQGTTSLGLALPMQSAVQAKANAVLVLNSHSYMILTPNYVCVCVCCDNSFAESSQSLRSNLKTNIHYKY